MLMYFLFLLFHFFAAVFWVGGMLFFVFVFRPVYLDPELSKVKSILLFKIAIQFRRITYYIFFILFLSGSCIIYFKGLYTAYLNSEYWTSAIGIVFLTKFGFFLLLLLSSILHDFLIGPIAFSEMEKNPSLRTKNRKYASFFGRVNLLISLIIAVLGLAYSRGFSL